MNPVFPIPLVQYKMPHLLSLLSLSLTIFYDYELN